MHEAMKSNRRYKVLMIGGSTLSKVLVDSILSASTEFALVEAIDTVNALAAAVDDHRPDVILIDLCSGQVDGGEALLAVRDHRTVRKVVLSAEPLAEAVQSDLAALGAIAFFQKHVIAGDHDAFRQSLRTLVGKSAIETIGTTQAGETAFMARSGAGVTVTPTPAALSPMRSQPSLFCDHAFDHLSVGANEEQMRQTALDALAIANGSQDHRLDLIVKHLCQVTDYPMAAVTLIDGSIQWIKAGCGIGRGTTPRTSAICDYTIRCSTPLIVADTIQHPIFSTFDCVLGEPHIRSYVGVPLAVEFGYAIGALCLLDTKPRACVQTELPVLNQMAALIIELLDKRWDRIAA
jgi:CheY-like chemotaxis protein